MKGFMDNGNVTFAAAVLLAHAYGIASQAPYLSDIIIMYGDDAPLQSPYTHIYPVLDEVIAALNANSRYDHGAVNPAVFCRGFTLPGAVLLWVQLHQLHVPVLNAVEVGGVVGSGD